MQEIEEAWLLSRVYGLALDEVQREFFREWLSSATCSQRANNLRDPARWDASTIGEYFDEFGGRRGEHTLVPSATVAIDRRRSGQLCKSAALPGFCNRGNLGELGTN